MDTIFWLVKIVFGLLVVGCLFFIITQFAPFLLGIAAILGIGALIIWIGWSMGGFVGALIILGGIFFVIAVAAVAFNNLAH